MLCEICHKKKATVHYTEIVQNNMVKINLCENCAHKKGISGNINFSMADLIGGLTHPEDKDAESQDMECDHCGITFSQFKEVGRFGCSRCYESFSKMVRPMLEAIHRSKNHIGKSPKALNQTATLEMELEHLQELLQEAIDQEEFEEACRIRDQVKVMKMKQEEKKEGKKAS